MDKASVDFNFDDDGFCAIQLESVHDLLIAGYHGDDEALDAAHEAGERNDAVVDKACASVLSGTVELAAWSTMSGRVAYVLTRSGRSDATGLQLTSITDGVPFGHRFVHDNRDAEVPNDALLVVVANGAKEIESTLHARYGISVTPDDATQDRKATAGSGSRSGRDEVANSPSGYHGDNAMSGISSRKPKGAPMTVPHIILEYDEVKKAALIVRTDKDGQVLTMPGNGESEYVACYGYNLDTQDWGQGHYYTDVAEAKVEFERLCGHEHRFARGKVRDDEFYTIRWNREDIASFLTQRGYPATEENIDDAIAQLEWSDFDERCIEDGWERIDGMVSLKQLDIGIEDEHAADLYKDIIAYPSSMIMWMDAPNDTFCFSVPDPEHDNMTLFAILCENLAEIGREVAAGRELDVDDLLEMPCIKDKVTVSVLENDLDKTRAALDASPVAKTYVKGVGDTENVRYKVDYRDPDGLNRKLGDIAIAWSGIYAKRGKDSEVDINPQFVAEAARKAATESDNGNKLGTGSHL